MKNLLIVDVKIHFWFLSLFFNIMVPEKLQAQYQLQWENIYNASEFNSPGKILMDHSNRIIMTSVSSNPYPDLIHHIHTIKYSTDGILLWDADWQTTNFPTGDSYDEVNAKNEIYVSAALRDTGILLLKYDSVGNFLWSKIFPDPGIVYFANAMLHVSDSGNIVQCAEGETSGGDSYKIITLKYDSSGTLLWSKKWNCNISQPYDFVLDANENVYITGLACETYDPYNGFYGGDAVILKINPAGHLVWENYFGDFGEDYGKGIVYDGMHSLYITGNFTSLSDSKMATVKCDTNGSIIWNNEYPDTLANGDYFSGYHVALGSDGMIYSLGNLLSFNNQNNERNLTLLKYDSSGSLLWNKYELNPTIQDFVARFFPNKLYEDAHGFYFAGGFNTGICNNEDNFVIYVLDSSGNVIDNFSFGGGPAQSCYRSVDFVVDSEDNIYALNFYRAVLPNDSSQIILDKFSTSLPLATNQRNQFLTKLLITPNPSSKLTTIELNNNIESNTFFTVYDLFGREVFRSEMKNNSVQLNCSSFSKGIYFVKAFHSQQLIDCKKLIVQ